MHGRQDEARRSRRIKHLLDGGKAKGPEGKARAVYGQLEPTTPGGKSNGSTTTGRHGGRLPPTLRCGKKIPTGQIQANIACPSLDN